MLGAGASRHRVPRTGYPGTIVLGTYRNSAACPILVLVIVILIIVIHRISIMNPHPTIVFALPVCILLSVLGPAIAAAQLFEYP